MPTPRLAALATRSIFAGCVVVTALAVQACSTEPEPEESTAASLSGRYEPGPPGYANIWFDGASRYKAARDGAMEVGTYTSTRSRLHLVPKAGPTIDLDLRVGAPVGSEQAASPASLRLNVSPRTEHGAGSSGANDTITAPGTDAPTMATPSCDPTADPGNVAGNDDPSAPTNPVSPASHSGLQPRTETSLLTCLVATLLGSNAPAGKLDFPDSSGTLKGVPSVRTSGTPVKTAAERKTGSDLAVVIVDEYPLSFAGIAPENNRVFESEIDNVEKLAAEARAAKMPIVIIEYSASPSDGEKTIARVANAAGLDRRRASANTSSPYLIAKTTDGAFENPKVAEQLNRILQSNGTKRVILAGSNETLCVKRTAQGFLANGYRIISSASVIHDPYLDNPSKERDIDAFYRANGSVTSLPGLFDLIRTAAQGRPEK